MQSTDEENSSIVESIPTNRMSSLQQSYCPMYEKYVYLYQFQREPCCLEEFMQWVFYRKLVIWRDNGTLLCLDPKSWTKYYEKEVSFTMEHVGHPHVTQLHGSIYGRTDADIAETMTFFFSLKHSGENARLEIKFYAGRDENKYDLSSLQPAQLARILDSNPTRHVVFVDGTLTPEQAMILATRSYPLNWKLGRKSVAFQDDGTAFVNALERRQSSFGALRIACRKDDIHFSRSNLKRLLKLDVFDKLVIGYLVQECVLLPFSAKVNVLDYWVDAGYIQQENYHSLDIVANDLTLKFNLERFIFPREWADHLIALLHRIAELGHLERLSVSTEHYDHDFGHLTGHPMTRVVDALVRAIHGNPYLQYLDLSVTYYHFDWDSHLQQIFAAMEEHTGIQTLKVLRYPNWADPGYSWLERLLSRNRNITVLDLADRRCTNRSSIDKLYSLNAMYHGSPHLLTESTSLRPLLVARAMLDRASGKFHHTALLLSNHMDMLCEFVDGSNLDTVAAAGRVMEETAPACPASAPPNEPTRRLKRKSRTQTSHNATKAARSET